MRIALAQINSTVGDLAGNAGKITDNVRAARDAGANLVVFPEMAMTGYPPEDLLLKPSFVRDNIGHLRRLARGVSGITAVAGFVDRKGRNLYNAAAVIEDRGVKHVYHKMLLPNYGVFDEKRYFAHGTAPLVATIAGVKTGINICEDIWDEKGPIRLECARGAKVLVVINASPYHSGKVNVREKILRRHARKYGVYVVYVNLVGGQDELVFDGYSMVAGPDGKMIAHAGGFREDLLVIDLPVGRPPRGAAPAPRRSALLAPAEEVYRALLLGLEDYVRKNGFRKVVVGLSGGVDSSLVATLAADALGPENVESVFMPSRYSSAESREDAHALARNLGIRISTIPIEEPFEAYLRTLEPRFKGLPPDITEENLQARIRGNYLMALSNKFGWLVLTTGNKSEMSTGYATLYGDMAGGFAVIKDVPKTLVYGLCGYRNGRGPAIPQRVIDKEPTAELRPNQKDSDSLPPYRILDPILKLYIEEDRSFREIIAAGYDEALVHKVINLVDRSEYKRRQAPPGIKITPKAFGKDRRMPITNRYTGKGIFQALDTKRVKIKE